ncbi:uncharacterized protein Tco025E_06833 [Trypanosoma conorhini]|uniref:Uncharacterized protein n=1 Tax=Trypanosoma conorhini TaxID=83891 RepID=A0A3R7KPV7_9TRYP|nr:uncharacterized protein Tco025E_06833 [Trypanosoma conorhini]RNF11227.1 hypothetical protein Tco025E_06833 [Trypanosoma conorhini]
MSREAPPPPTICRAAEDVSPAAVEADSAAALDLRRTNGSTLPLRTSMDDADDTCSATSEEVEDGLLETEQSVASREAVWGSPCIPKNEMGAGHSGFPREDSSSCSVNGERETMQLNKQNLSRMEKELSDGKAALHPELLDDDAFGVKRPTSKERHVSVVSVASEEEEGARGSLITSDVEQFSPYMKPNKSRKSLFDNSVCSIESVCGSVAAPDILSRKNLDRFASQLSAGVRELKPEMLLGDALQELQWELGHRNQRQADKSLCRGGKRD